MKKLLTCLALSTVLFSGCTLMQKSEGIIKVNDTVITQSEFDKAFDEGIDKSFLKQFGGSKNFVKSDENPMFGIFKDKIVHELIIKSLLDEEIAKRGITATEEDVQNEIKTIIDKVGSKEELNRLLKQRGVSNSQFTDYLKTQIYWFHTPGHTKGSVCILIEDWLFTGDTIIPGVKTYTKFPGGSKKDLLCSFNRLNTFLDNRVVTVLPGHLTGYTGNIKYMLDECR